MCLFWKMKPFDYMRFDLQPDRDAMAYAHEPGEDFWLIKQMLFFCSETTDCSCKGSGTSGPQAY